TADGIKHNKQAALEAAIFEVLPGAVTRQTFAVEDAGPRPLGPEEEVLNRVFAGYDAQGELVGLAIEAAGQGYQDVVRILYGYSPDEDKVIGYKLLESKETPGLGDRIGKDEAFLANFAGLDMALTADGQALANPVTFVKQGQKNNPWEIDGISGATISSKAVTNMLNTRSAEVVPYLKQHADVLRSKP
ncbi:MAG: FMN-binding protein, partial [Candidatus Hydrogenedentes bacterium]|nr:FMN-binding protein [Candidatus Hydrogenedentota bacterium]